jgi:hypothetical protein
VKNINLWLSDYIDYSLVNDGDTNVLVGDTPIAKFNTNKDANIVSPVYWLTDVELFEFASQKKKWLAGVSQSIRGLFSENMKSNGIDFRYAGALEKLFFQSQLACLDALMFAKSCTEKTDKNVTLKIIVGNKYQLSTLSSLVFWLAACDIFFSKKQKDFYVVTREKEKINFTCTSDLLKYLSSILTTKPEIKGTVKYNEQNVCIAWVGALKFSLGWDKVMNPAKSRDLKIMRIVQPVQKSMMPRPLLTLSPGNGDGLISLRELYNFATDSINNCNPLISSNVVKNFYEIGVIPYLIGHVGDMIECIDDKLCNINVVNFYSVSAPQIESIALHISIAKKGVLPILLPHSYTQSYFFPPETYKESLTFIKSNFILNGLSYDLSGLNKERTTSISQIQMLHNNALSKFSFMKLFLIKLEYLTQYKFSKWPSLLQASISERTHSSADTELHIKTVKKSRICLGLVTNVESNDFSIRIDFNELFGVINSINQKMIDRLGRNAVLNVRTKPGWSNKRLLRQSFPKIHPPLVCPTAMSLLEYGKNCHLVLFMHGTSAVAELMQNETPCVCLDGAKLLTVFGLDAISYPVEIVPMMTIEEILEKLFNSPEWLIELSKIQSNWIELQI